MPCTYPNCDCPISFPEGHTPSEATECPISATGLDEIEITFTRQEWRLIAVALASHKPLSVANGREMKREMIGMAHRIVKRTGRV
jgi:hypothetical protein